MHSYAGYENKVKTNLESRIASLDMEDYIFQVEVPTEEVTEVKNGKRMQVQRKVFPGYILVRMDLNDESWGAVRNTPGVTGFVGATSRPSPLTVDEVVKILVPATQKKETRPQVKVVDFEVGESVTVMDGAVRHAPRHDQRDQPGRAEGQGAGLDLRAGDARRAVLQPGFQDLEERRTCPRRGSSLQSSSCRSRPVRRRRPRRSAPRWASTA